MENYLKKLKSPFFILFVIVLTFILRIAYLERDLFFGYEQARDLFNVSQIVSGDIKLIGPSTDIDGIFHGVLYFYIVLPLLLVFNGDPFLIQATIVVINSVAIIFLYKAVREFHSERAAHLSIFFYAVSYSSIIYARWLSNTNLIPAAAIMLYWFLIKARKKWWYLAGAAISWGTIFQFHEVVGMSLVIPSCAFVLVEKVELNVRRISIILTTILFVVSSYIVFEIKNNFGQLTVLKDYIVNKGTGSEGLSFFFEFVQEVSDSLFPTSARSAFIIFMTLIVVASREFLSRKRELLTILFLIAPPLFFGLAGIVPLRHFYITVPVFLSVTVALIVNKLFKKKHSYYAYLLTAVIVSANMFAYTKKIPHNLPSFIYHAQRTYMGDLKNVIDWVYMDADGKPFSYDYYSIPYWRQEMWEYMFTWYGKSKYGYTPTYDRTEVFYTLIEPNETIPVHLDNWYGEYKKELELIDTFSSGKLIAEKRIKKVKYNVEQ